MPLKVPFFFLLANWVGNLPIPGDGGDEMAFAYDGATFTPGEFVADSGSRTVDIELTLASAAITSGVCFVLFTLNNDSAYNNCSGGTESALTAYWGGPSAGYLLGSTDDGFLLFWLAAADGHTKTTVTLNNSGASAETAYLGIVLISTGAVLTEEISIPGVGE